MAEPPHGKQAQPASSTCQLNLPAQPATTCHSRAANNDIFLHRNKKVPGDPDQQSTPGGAEHREIWEGEGQIRNELPFCGEMLRSTRDVSSDIPYLLPSITGWGNSINSQMFPERSGI